MSSPPSYRILFERRALDQLAAIEAWIAERADRETALRIGDALLARCQGLAVFPERGSSRDDIRLGLRTVPYGSRYTIGYRVMGDRVIILGITGRGQSLSALIDD